MFRVNQPASGPVPVRAVIAGRHLPMQKAEKRWSRTDSASILPRQAFEGRRRVAKVFRGDLWITHVRLRFGDGQRCSE